jgi:hypothetical protein
MIKETKMELWNIILGFIIIIIIYCFYLNIINKYNKIEGFTTSSNKIDSLINPSNKIQKLIETNDSNAFTIKLWDNYNVLSATYEQFKLNVPTDRNECLRIIKAGVPDPNVIDKKKLDSFIKLDPYDYATSTLCPLSIWRSSPIQGFESIGDVVSTIFKNPSIEQVVDMTKPMTSNNPNLINLKTKIVAGNNTVPPEDFVYVGSFGKDKVEDRLLMNERMNQDLKMISSKLQIFGDAMKAKKKTFIDNMNTVSKSLQDSAGVYINQFSKLGKFDLYDYNTKNNLTDMIKFNTDNNIKTDSNILILNNNNNIGINSSNFNVKIDKIYFNVGHSYNITSLLSSMTYEVIEKFKSIYDFTKEQSIFSYNLYSYNLSNLNLVNQDSLNGNVGNIRNYNVKHIGESSLYQDSHSVVQSPKNITTVVNIMKSTWNNPDPTNDVIQLGNMTGIDQAVLAFHPATQNDSEYRTQSINSMTFNVLSDYLNTLQNDIFNNFTIQNAYNNLVTEINNFYTRNPSTRKTDYYQLSIWRPIPPPGYVALGCVFTNDPKDVKPSVKTIKCIPQTCVKSFKRRKWLPSDIVFIYSDPQNSQEQQKLAFYRNPYLGTCVVVDLNKYNNSNTGNTIKNPDPSFIKYRNDKDSLAWECFDIVPCVKECDYIKRLEDSEKNARQMCSAYRGLENQYFDKTEIKKSVQDEENKYNTLLKDKKTYIENLMGKINKLMTEDELYKIISQNINRYKTKKDLEEQRDIHGKVADKLLQTRGLEISWDNPTEMLKFKDLVKRLVVAQFSKVKINAEKRDCPVCKLPDTEDFVKFKDLELCYGCMEDVVRELLDKKKKANEPIPPELLALQTNITK